MTSSMYSLMKGSRGLSELSLTDSLISGDSEGSREKELTAKCLMVLMQGHWSRSKLKEFIKTSCAAVWNGDNKQNGPDVVIEEDNQDPDEKQLESPQKIFTAKTPEQEAAEDMLIANDLEEIGAGVPPRMTTSMTSENLAKVLLQRNYRPNTLTVANQQDHYEKLGSPMSQPNFDESLVNSMKKSRSWNSLAMTPSGSMQDMSYLSNRSRDTSLASISDVRNAIYVAEIEEISINPTVARRGLVNVISSHGKPWQRYWVVVRRPYVFFHAVDSSDGEEFIVNLGKSQIECAEEQKSKHENVFAMVGQFRTVLVQCATNEEFFDWLYAVSPLLAGKLR